MYHGWQCLDCDASSEQGINPIEHQQASQHAMVPTEGH